MALWTVAVKATRNINGLRLERGMSVQVSSMYHPISYNNGEATRHAFMRIYGIDLKKAGALSIAYFDIEKQN